MSLGYGHRIVQRTRGVELIVHRLNCISNINYLASHQRLHVALFQQKCRAIQEPIRRLFCSDSYPHLLFMTHVLTLSAHILILVSFMTSQIAAMDSFVQCKIQNGGTFTVLVHRDWSPLGAQRFLDLVNDGFYDGAALFRCQKDITVQFGIPKSREQMKRWHKIGNIKDDPKRHDLFEQSHWRKGLLSFAGGGADSRGGQIFVTLNDDIPNLGGERWETPFAEVIEGLHHWKEDVYFEYGDRNGPDQGKLYRDNAYTEYLPKEFPLLSYMDYCQQMIEEQHHEEIGHILTLEMQQIFLVCLFVICCMGFVVFAGYKNQEEVVENKSDYAKVA